VLYKPAINAFPIGYDSIGFRLIFVFLFNATIILWFQVVPIFSEL